MHYDTYKAAHTALMAADRTRGRVLSRVMEKQNGGPAAVDRLSNRAWDRAQDRARRHPDYREADEAYTAISQYIRDHFPASERKANRRLARRMGL